MEFEIIEGTLKGARGYDKYIALPEGIIRIAEGAFTSFCDLEGIALPSSLRQIGDHAFNNCLGLLNVDIPDGVERIGEYAFQYCRCLRALHLPSALKKLECCALRYCESLERIDVPASVTEVEYDAFYGCKELKSFSAPEGCIFGRHAFYGCDELAFFDAPVSAFKELSEAQRARTAVAFCRAPEGYSAHSRTVFESYLRAPSEEFMALICAADDAQALNLITSRSLLGAPAAELFLALASRQRAYKCLSALMEYKNSRFSAGGIDKMMKELEL